MKMANELEIRRAKTVLYRPDSYSLRQLLNADPLIPIMFYVFCVINIATAAVAIYSDGYYINIFLNTSLALMIMFCYFLWLDVKQEDNKEVFIKNKKGEKFMFCLGKEVGKFHGNAVKSMRASGNLKRPLLVNAETVKRHFLVMATIGSGKSVFMKGLIEQMCLLGGASFIIEGKGTTEFAKEVYGLMLSLGREDDFVHINLLDMNNTHSINPLKSGSANSIYEILISLLIGEENEWKAKQKEFMKNILKLMVYKRDYENFNLNFSSLVEMMSLEALLEEAMDYKDKAREFKEIEDFCQFVTTSIGISYKDFLAGDNSDKAWRESMQKKLVENKDMQGVYDASVSISAWRSPLTTLKSDYGRVFNAPNPDMSLWEAIQYNKIIFVTLPTMDSDTTPKELGRLLLGLIKGVAAQKAKYSRQPTIPCLIACDEIGSYKINGFARLESKSRSLGIGIMPIFQSPAQIDVDDKNDYERKEMIDVTGVHILMKNMHPETSEFYGKMVKNEAIISRDYSARRDMAKGQGSVEDSYKSELKSPVEHYEVANMNEGEMMIFANGKMNRAVAQAETSVLERGKPVTYEGKSDEKIPLMQYVAKEKFFNLVNPIISRQQSKFGLYNFLKVKAS